MKAFVYPEQALVVWASRKLERPVKWQEDRSEGFVSDNQGRDHVTRAELALDDEGRFLGLRVSLIANLGAYLSPFGSVRPDALDRPRLRHLRDAGDRTSTSRACAPTRCRSAPIAAPGGPRPATCSSGWSMPPRASWT